MGPVSTFGARRRSPLLDRLALTDVGSISDLDLIAVLVLGSTRRDPELVAAELLATYRHDLDALVRMDRTPDDCVSETCRLRFKAVAELERRARTRRAVAGEQPIVVRTAAEAYDILATLSAGPAEHLSVLWLDRRHRLIGSGIVTRGTEAATIVDPKQILSDGLRRGAAAFILAHQHPSGDREPSTQDLDVTRRLGQAARIIGIDFLDHLVLGGPGDWTSLRERAPELFRS
jgi:DNA repair protein RadC